MRIPEQPCLSCGETQSTTVCDCRHADRRGLEQGGSTFILAFVVETPDKPSKLAASCQSILDIDMDCLREEIEIDSE